MQQHDVLVYTDYDILQAVDRLFNSELLSLWQQAVAQNLGQQVLCNPT